MTPFRVLRSCLSALLLLSLTLDVPAQSACETGASFELLGGGSPGIDGQPLLAASGAPVVGCHFRFQLFDGRPGGLGLLVLGHDLSPQPLPGFGATFLPGGVFAEIPFELSRSGDAELIGTPGIREELCGLGFVAQAVVFDPSAQGGVAFSNGARLTVGTHGEFELQQGATFGAGNGPAAVTTDDLNGDGLPDLASTNVFDDDVSVRLGDGTGSFGPPIEFAVQDGPRDLIVVDVDADGSVDLVACNFASDSFSVLLGDGTGAFAPALHTSVDDDPFAIDSGDVDGDGNQDMAVGCRDGSAINVRLGAGDGSFTALPSIDMAPLHPNAIALSDLDGDGVLDMAAGFESAQPGKPFGVAVAMVRVGNGDGTFGSESFHGLGFGGSVGTETLGVADLDLDGDLDLVLGGTAQSLSTLLNDGSGGFPTGGGVFGAALVSPSDSFRGMAVADIDLDGIPDVIGTFQTVQVQLGVGDGTFAEPVEFDVGGDASYPAVADLNSDCSPDVAVCRSQADDLTILLNSPLD